jgi:hypothetical protein
MHLVNIDVCIHTRIVHGAYVTKILARTETSGNLYNLLTTLRARRKGTLKRKSNGWKTSIAPSGPGGPFSLEPSDGTKIPPRNPNANFGSPLPDLILSRFNSAGAAAPLLAGSSPPASSGLPHSRASSRTPRRPYFHPLPSPRTRSTAAAQDSTTREAPPPGTIATRPGCSPARACVVARGSVERACPCARMADAVRSGCCTPARWRRPPGRADGSDESHGGPSYATRCNPHVSSEEGRRCSVVCAGTANPAAVAHRPPSVAVFRGGARLQGDGGRG